MTDILMAVAMALLVRSLYWVLLRVYFRDNQLFQNLGLQVSDRVHLTDFYLFYRNWVGVSRPNN